MIRTNGMKHTWMLGIVVITLAAVALGPRPAAAIIDTDVRAGVYSDMSAVSLGGGLLSSMGSRWYFNPNIEAAFGDNGNLMTLNGDFHYDFAVERPVSVYLGGGPAVLFAHPDGSDSRADIGLNLLGGVAGMHGDVRPFAQIKGVMSDNSEVALMGGIRF